tara:strand:+ start:248 stop:445 length:198 start_codon:yes stop_codon:yes gene_type:complete
MSDTNVTMELKDTETETKDEVSISKQDLLTLLNLLQVSAQRGTFKLNEFKDVGLFFEKMNNMVNK